MIGLTFVDRKCERESFRRGVVFGARLGDSRVGVAVVAIVEPQLLAVFCDAVGVVDIAADQKAQHVGCGGLDHGGELALAEHVIADEIDLPHCGLLAFGDGEDKIDAVGSTIDDFRYHADVVAPGMPIGFHDAADVGLHRGALQRAPCLGLHHASKFGVLDFLVAFECDAVEQLCFGQVDHHFVASPLNRHVVEQPGRDQRLQRGVEGCGIELFPRPGMKIRPHGIGLDPPIAFHNNGLARRRGVVGGQNRHNNER